MTQAFGQRQRQPLDPVGTGPDKAVVVGVDNSDPKHAAAAWAVAEAAASGRPLTLLHVLDEQRAPVPLHGLETHDQRGWKLLTQVESLLRGTAPAVEIRKEMAVGPVDTALVNRSAGQATLVVGRRGLGSFSRLLVGSSSLSVASLARVPVVVVPHGWLREAHEGEPVVVGVDHHDVQREALTFAFAEAQLRGVPLVAAHGCEMPDLDRDEDATVSEVTERADHDSADALRHAIEPWRQAHPDVNVSLLDRREHPLTVLLDQAGPAQLLVLGRHSNRRRGGFPFGSVARGVLHHAEVPVAIVPPVP